LPRISYRESQDGT
jgi:hypothetical protein